MHGRQALLLCAVGKEMPIAKKFQVHLYTSNIMNLCEALMSQISYELTIQFNFAPRNGGKNYYVLSLTSQL
jgi:hypothetical protein